MNLATLAAAFQSVVGEMTTENIGHPPKLMGKGMLGIFVVVVLIYMLIVGLNKLTGGKKGKR